MFTQEQILYAVIIIMIVIFIYAYIVKDDYQNVLSDELIKTTNKLNNFLTSQTTFPEYLDFVKKENIKSIDLINQNSFYELKTLKKLLRNLKPENVAEYAKDI